MRVKFKQAIKDSGLTISDLADRLNMHRSNVYNQIHRRTNFLRSAAERAAKILNIPVDDVYN